MADNKSKKATLSVAKSGKIGDNNFLEAAGPKYICKHETGLAGFGSNVYSICNIKSGSRLCYINDFGDISFPVPLHIYELKDLLIFLNSDDNPYLQSSDKSYYKTSRS